MSISVNGTVVIGASSGFSNPMVDAWDLIVGGAGGSPSRLEKGLDGQALTSYSGYIGWSTPGVPFTNINLSSSLGWTLLSGSGGATATINNVSKQIELVVPDGLSLGQRYALVYSDSYLDGSGMDVKIHIRAAMLDASANDYIQLILIDTSDTVFLQARVDGNGLITARVSGGSTAGVTVPAIFGSQGWIRLRQYGGSFIVYAGIGLGGSEPASWTTIGAAQLTSSAIPPLVRLRVDLTRDASGSDVAYVDVGDISYRQTVAL